VARGAFVNLLKDKALEAGTGSEAKDWSPPSLTSRRVKHEEADLHPGRAVFALSSGFALAASHTGAQPMEKKDEMKKGDKSKDKKKSKKTAKKAEPRRTR